MVLFRALGWLLLAMAVAVLVNDGLAWWSEGAFRLLPLGGLWSRLDYGSLHALEYGPAGPWRGLLKPLLELPALPVFAIGGVILLWVGRRIGSRAEPRFVGSSRPPRRRRSSGLS